MNSDVKIKPSKNKKIFYNKPIKTPAVNKNYKKKRIKKVKNVSVITVTNKEKYFENIINNYLRQDHKSKELIIIINKDNISLENWINKTKKHDTIKIFKINEKKSLGFCLNYGVKKAKFSIISKFDDDDYYGKKYLTQVINTFNYTGADIVGKGKYYIYFEGENILAINKGSSQNKFTKHLAGGTISFEKLVFKKVKFKDLTYGTDQRFLKDCKNNNFRIFSNNKSNYIYVRHKSTNEHTWKMSNKKFLKKCKILKKSKKLPKID
ncbi:MAG: glycosyltransferase family 2 protein [Firmicutes bacterium]|nr:glycosyltransferase family 2 protein [Bacillota bacterium]